MEYKIYIDSDGYFHVNDRIIPQKDLFFESKEVDGTQIICIQNTNTNQFIVLNTPISDIKDGIGVSYVDADALIEEIGSVFKNIVDVNPNTDPQTPTHISSDSVYDSDIDFVNSDFSDWTGDPANLFKSPFSSYIENATSNNPKQIIVAFNRTVSAMQIGLGDNSNLKFSNVKISLLGSGGVVRSLYDGSVDNTKLSSLNAKFERELFNSILIEFYTADTIRLSNITIQKARYNTVQIEGLSANGNLIVARVTEDGDLSIADNSNGLAIARGLVSGASFIHKFGAAPDFDVVNGFVTVWDGADDVTIAQHEYIYSVTDDIDSLVSQDAAANQLIEVQGLDVNYNIVIQSITLNGQSRVALTTPLLRVFRMKNISNSDLQNHCYVYVDTPLAAGVPIDTTKIRGMIHEENNQTEMAVFTIPAGKTGYMRDWYSSTAGARRDSSHTIRVLARPFNQVFQLKHTGNIDVTGTSYIKHTYTEPEVFTEKTDVEIRVNTSENIASVAAGFDIVLIDN